MRKAIDWAQVKARLAKTQAAIEQSLHPDSERLAAVFTQRAERFARRRDASEDTAAGLHVLVFKIGTECFALEISEIAEVLPMPKVTPVPAAPQGLFGVFNLRGEIVPIIELAAVLGLAPAEESAGYILMLRNFGSEAGLKAGELIRIQRIAPGDSLPVEEIASERSKRFFKGITRDATLILNLDKLLEHEIFSTH